jgi:hypothetical protein
MVSPAKGERHDALSIGKIDKVSNSSQSFRSEIIEKYCSFKEFDFKDRKAVTMTLADGSEYWGEVTYEYGAPRPQGKGVITTKTSKYRGMVTGG